MPSLSACSVPGLHPASAPIADSDDRQQLLELLAGGFPTLKRVAGADAFGRLCVDYLDAHRAPRTGLQRVGHGLPRHLARSPRGLRRPVLAQIAAFDWGMGLATEGAGAHRLPLDAVAALPPQSWPAMSFTLHASVQRVNLDWNVPELHADATGLLRARRHPKTHAWLIWHRGQAPQWRRLSPDEARLLDAVRRGEPFATVCDRLAQAGGEAVAAHRAAGLLHGWIADGLLASVSVDLSRY